MKKPAKSTVPRGIQIVEWKNQDDRRNQIRFRVRIKRKSFKCDELFKTLDEAKDFLAMNTSAKTRALYGPALVAAEESTNPFANPNFLYYAKLYVQKKITPRIEARRDRANQVKDYTTRVNAIARVLVEASESGDIKHSKFGGILVEGWTFGKVKLGTLRLDEITGRVITTYIQERLKSVKPTTVQRELQFLAAVFNWIKDYDSNAWAKCGNRNPVTAADRNALKIAMELKQAADSMLPDRRVTPQQRRALFDALNKRENKELLLISALCHATGMRRSEAMLLRWQQLRPDYIQLGITKRGKPRKVPITAQVREILKNVVKTDDRLFHYSVYGFNSAWQRLLDSTQILDDDDNLLMTEIDGKPRPLTLRDTQLRFHNMRHEYISRLVELQLENKLPSIAAQQLAGIEDVRHYENRYVEPAKEQQHISRVARGIGTNTTEDLMRDVGHSSIGMTSHYASVGTEPINAIVDSSMANENRDPKILKARIAQLEQQLANLTKSTSKKTATARAKSKVATAKKAR